MRYRCSQCRNDFGEFVEVCPVCGEWRTLFASPTPANGAPTRQERRRAVPTPLVDLWSRDAKRLALRADWTFLGALPWQFSIMAYGPAGGGKSTFLFRFADELARQGRVLLVPTEMGTSNLTADMARRLECRSRDVLVSSAMDEIELEQDVREVEPKFLVVDSVTHAKMSLAFLSGIAESRKIGIAFSLHMTKGGDFVGESSWAHWVDVVLYVEGLRFKAEKNRFGVLAEGSVVSEVA
jgi:DNA repair protein RadA/Sms